VALFEAGKGLIIILAGCGLLTLIHAGAQDVAETLITHFHLNPASRFPHIFLDVAAHLDDTRLWLMAGFALVYASLRFIEAFGLWFHRAWAEWFAALSGAVYVPFELYEMAKGYSPLKLITLSLNLMIVLYMSRVLFIRYQGRGAIQ
jgi:uncharacterized membrane protein (DUF2068 family)